MSFTVTTPLVPAQRPAALSKTCAALFDAIASYFIRRAAAAALHELDDRALRDIGLARTQIEAAVHGRIARPGRGQ